MPTTSDGTPLPTIDTGASDADKTVTTLISATEKPIEAAIIAEVPEMAIPVWKQIWEGTLGWLLGVVGGVLGRLTGYAFIDVQELIALRNAASALAALKAAQASGDKNAITQANAQTDEAVTPILQYIGSFKS